MKAEFRQAPFQPIWYWLLLHPDNGQVIAESFTLGVSATGICGPLGHQGEDRMKFLAYAIVYAVLMALTIVSAVILAFPGPHINWPAWTNWTCAVYVVALGSLALAKAHKHFLGVAP